MNFTKLIAAAFLLSLFSSCSLEYLKSENSENTTPEFIFNRANFTRYETGLVKMRMKAEKIEQYKSDGSSYAKNAEFDSYNSKGELETSGNCGLMESNTNSEKYKLFDRIYLNMVSQKMEINAENLFFDKKTEQVTSDINSEVFIKKEDMTITGTGFTASGISKSFTFEDQVSGTITTSNDEDEDIQETEDGIEE
ncbi:MAG: LPS export ABC transporter periplasmic protein LptC [Treponema sp.]|nr:LPS export ABC transporter periplasmic protein LptC [Candidatus Treponema equifaecale]